MQNIESFLQFLILVVMLIFPWLTVEEHKSVIIGSGAKIGISTQATGRF